MSTTRIEYNWINLPNKYWASCLIAMKETLYFPQKLRATAILVPFRFFVVLLIYRYAFAYAGRTVNGLNADSAVWSIAVYHVLLYAQFRGIFATINDEIKRGSFETQLIKPYDYITYKLCEQLGKGLPNLAISLVTVVPLLYMLTGGLPTSFAPATTLGALSLIMLGTLVSGAFYVLVALPAFWIDDAQPLFWIVDKAIMVFGGAYIPIALMPATFQTIANLTPFGAPMFATQMFQPDFAERWLTLFVVQAFWIIVLLAAVFVVFRRAQLRLSVNGG